MAEAAVDLVWARLRGQAGSPAGSRQRAAGTDQSGLPAPLGPLPQGPGVAQPGLAGEGQPRAALHDLCPSRGGLPPAPSGSAVLWAPRIQAQRPLQE